MMFVSKTELDSSVKMLKDYKEQGIIPDNDPEKLWRAKKGTIELIGLIITKSTVFCSLGTTRGLLPYLCSHGCGDPPWNGRKDTTVVTREFIRAGQRDDRSRHAATRRWRSFVSSQFSMCCSNPPHSDMKRICVYLFLWLASQIDDDASVLAVGQSKLQYYVQLRQP
jgi:hypothetical protein